MQQCSRNQPKMVFLFVCTKSAAKPGRDASTHQIAYFRVLLLTVWAYVSNSLDLPEPLFPI